jgi:hypothetical protein
MIKADMLFIKDDNFYDQVNSDGKKVTGYELFFQLILNFKNKFNYTIHTFHESDKSIQFDFKSDYMINLKEYSSEKHIELYSSNESIEDFTEKFNYLKEIMNGMNIK